MSIFDVMGPIMIGPSSSHTAGAAKIGYLAHRVYGKPISRVQIALYNSFAETGWGHGTNKAILGGILGLRVDDPRIKRSFEIAAQAGIDVTFEQKIDPEKHPNYASVTFRDADGSHPFVVEGISVGGGAAKIVRINGAGVDFSGKHNLLFVTYRDTPGMMALLGDGLGARSINVAYAQISRNKNTGEAMAIMKLDQPCPDELVRYFRSQPGITDVVAINKLGSEYERTEED
ncbi:L-serine ammonia-lyase, iron-sulfur-dependent subunit beta [bacterium]|nr:L-serine ammonia-lyase, iron-sulfur-dependent subunit beta [bacterium]